MKQPNHARGVPLHLSLMKLLPNVADQPLMLKIFSEADNEVEVTEADDEPEMGGYGDGMCILFNTTKLFNLVQSTTMWLLHLRSIRISQLQLPSPNVSFYSRYYIFFN